MPGGSDPTVGIHNLAYPICYMRAYINKSSKSMRIWNALSAKCPRFSLLKVHQQGASGSAMSATRLAAGLKALSRLTNWEAAASRRAQMRPTPDACRDLSELLGHPQRCAPLPTHLS